MLTYPLGHLRAQHPEHRLDVFHPRDETCLRGEYRLVVRQTVTEAVHVHDQAVRRTACHEARDSIGAHNVSVRSFAVSWVQNPKSIAATT